MGIIDKDGAMYLATGVDTTGLLEGKREVLEILKAMMQETASVNVFSDIELAAATAFTHAAADTYELSRAFENNMQMVATISPQIGASLGDYENRVINMTRSIPVAANDCAAALYRIVTAGYDGSEAMTILEQAAREAVVAATGVADAFARMQEGGTDLSAWTATFSDLDYSESLTGVESQLQLLQNRILAVSRSMGEQVVRQVANVATLLGDALSDGRVEKSFRSLDTLITLASGALADYRKEVEGATGEISAEGVALEIASGIRQAYHEVVENGIVQREAEVLQQQAYQEALAQSQAQEVQGNAVRDAMLQKSMDLVNMVALEDSAYRGKLTDMRELLSCEQEELSMNEQLLVSAEELLVKRKTEYEEANNGLDVGKMELAYSQMLEAAEKKEAAAMEVANMKRKVKSTQIQLNTLERRGETAAIAGNVTATTAETIANTGNTVGTGILTVAKRKLTVAMWALNGAMAANPIGMVLSVVSLAITAFSMFGKKTEDSASAIDKLNESLDKQKERVSNLVNILYDENEADQKRVAALLELRKIYPQVWKDVDLANLKERDRNKLIKEGNEALEERRKKELELAAVESRAKLQEMEEKDFFDLLPPGILKSGVDVVKDYFRAKEYNNLEGIEGQLKNIRDLEKAVGQESLTKDDKLAKYNQDLDVLSWKLKNVQEQIDETKENMNNTGDFSLPVLGQSKLANLEQQKTELQGQANETKQRIDGLNKPAPLTDREKRELEAKEKERAEKKRDIQKTLEALALKYSQEAEKKELERMPEGHKKLIKEIELEYAERGRVIEREEKNLQEMYDGLKEKMPDSEKQVFAERKKANADEESQKIREVEERNKEEISSRIKSMRKRTTSIDVTTEEEQNRKRISDKYDGERAWAENQVKNSAMSAGDAKSYNENIDLVIQKEQHARLLAELNDYNQKRQTITAEWDAKIKTAEGDDGLIAKLEKKKEENLSALGTEQLMQSEEWTGLFENLDELTISQIDELTGKIQAKMAEVQKGEGENGTVNAFKITSKDMKTITAELNKAKEKIATLNPFRAMGDSMKETFAGGATEAGDASQKIGDKWEYLGKSTEGCFEFVNDAVGSCSVLSDLIGESGQQTIGMIQGLMTAGIMMGAALKNAENGSVVLKVISAAIMAVTAIASMFNGDKKQEKKIKRLQGQIDDLDDSYKRLGTTMENTYSDKVYGMMEDQNENLRQQQELIKKQIEAEDKKKKTDKGKIRDWQSQLKDIDEQIAENERKQIEMLAGTDVKSAIDSFADALTDAYAKGEDGAKALGDTTKKVMANAVKESLKKKFLGDAINEAVNFLGNAMGDGVLTAEEQAEFESIVRKGGENFMTAMDSSQNLFRDLEGAMGEGVTGQLQAAMTEGTASQLVGLWNTTASDVRAIRDWLLTGVATMPESPFDMTRMIDLQNEIAVNTRMTAQSTTATMYELHEGLMRMDYRLEAIEMNTRGYGGRGR